MFPKCDSHVAIRYLKCDSDVAIMCPKCIPDVRVLQSCRVKHTHSEPTDSVAIAAPPVRFSLEHPIDQCDRLAIDSQASLPGNCMSKIPGEEKTREGILHHNWRFQCGAVEHSPSWDRIEHWYRRSLGFR